MAKHSRVVGYDKFSRRIERHLEVSQEHYPTAESGLFYRVNEGLVVRDAVLPTIPREIEEAYTTLQHVSFTSEGRLAISYLFDIKNRSVVILTPTTNTIYDGENVSFEQLKARIRDEHELRLFYHEPTIDEWIEHVDEADYTDSPFSSSNELRVWLLKVKANSSWDALRARRKEYDELIIPNERSIVTPESAEDGYMTVPIPVLYGCDKHCPPCKLYPNGLEIYELSRVIEQIERIGDFLGKDTDQITVYPIVDGDVFLLSPDDLEVILNTMGRVLVPDYEYEPQNSSDKGYANAFAKPTNVIKYKDHLSKMRRLGLGNVNMGPETFLPEVLKKVKPWLNISDVVEAAHLLDQAGLSYSFNLMPELGGKENRGRNVDAAVDFFRRNPSVRPHTVYVPHLERTDAYLSVSAKAGWDESEILAGKRRSYSFVYDYSADRLKEGLAEFGIPVRKYRFLVL